MTSSLVGSGDVYKRQEEEAECPLEKLIIINCAKTNVARINTVKCKETVSYTHLTLPTICSV
eukprot:12489006-Prorocentrum_lima.AAC.1